MNDWIGLVEQGPKFSNWNDATRSLLLSSATALNRSGAKYVIVGGWVPTLMEGHPHLQHPGTRDVDVLFDGDISTMRRAVESMLDGGFIPSAKHDFQMMRPLHVHGRTFVFNVDFMHPAEKQVSRGLLTEVFDLGVDDEFDPSGKRWVRSIVFRSAPLVFEEHMWRPRSVSGILPDGQNVEVAIPLLSQAALVLSKAESVKEPKRPRDAFDIYFVLSGPNGGEIHRELSDLAARHPAVAERLSNLRSWIIEESEAFKSRVEQFSKDGVDDPVALVLPLLTP